MKSARNMTGKLLLTLAVLGVALAGIAQALTISGTLKLKNSTATPGVTKARVDAYGPNGGRAFGTYVTFSNTSSASYSIKGVDIAAVSDVRAHVDTHNDLYRHPMSASGVSPIVNGTTANLELYGYSPALPVQPPAGAYILACDQTALVVWESVFAQSGFVAAAADSYNVYWSANQLSGLASWKALPEDQKRTGIKPGESSNTFVRGLTNGSGYYFAITAVINGFESEPYVSPSTTIGKPLNGNFTATINLDGLTVPTDTVYAMLMPKDGPPVAIGSATAGDGPTVQITVPLPALPDGVYALASFVDKNPDSSFGLADFKSIEGPGSLVTIANNTGSGSATLSNLPAQLELNSDHWKNSNPANGFEGYGLYLGGGSHFKLPVAINVTGTNLPAGGIDLGIENRQELWMGTFADFGPTAPSGDYTFNVTYSDGTSLSTIKPSTVLTNFPTAISPSGTVDQFNPTPTFNWSAPSSPAPVSYNLMLQQNGTTLWQQEKIPGNATSIVYPATNVTPLQDKSSYSWGISAVDGFGNRITRWTDFNFGVGGGTPAITASGSVWDSQNAGIPGTSIKAYTAYDWQLISTTTPDNTGAFALTVPPNTTFVIEISAPGYRTAYSQNIILDKSTYLTSFILMTNNEYTGIGWPLTPGKAFIRGSVQGSNSIPLSGVTLTAASSNSYTVKYVNSQTWALDAPSTTSPGIFAITNAMPGDTITLTAIYAGKTFHQPVFSHIVADTDCLGLAFETTPADNQAPTVPANVTATAVSSSRIDINWTTSTDNVGVTYYKVFRNGGDLPAGTPGGQDNNYWWDDNRTPNTTYNYSVAACDAAGNCSVPSSAASATTFSAASQTTTAIVLASGANPSFYGDPLTFTASVSPSNATGTIQFKVNGVNSGSPVNIVGGSATSAPLSSMKPGAFSVTADYSGSQGFLASTSAPFAQSFKYAVKIGDQPYQNLASAFAAGGQILAREMTFTESAPISILLATNFKGGYSDDGFSNNTGKFTTLARPLTIQTGSLTVEGLAIR